MATITLTIEVDDQDVDLLDQVTYVKALIRWDKPLHAAVAERMGISGVVIDHIDRNPLNNKRSNLRPANKRQNSGNVGLQRNNTSGYKGVVWNKQRQRYQAQLMVNKHKTYLGLFDSAEDAARAYDRAALEHFGDYAYTNFPREEYP